MVGEEVRKCGQDARRERKKRLGRIRRRMKEISIVTITLTIINCCGPSNAPNASETNMF